MINSCMEDYMKTFCETYKLRNLVKEPTCLKKKQKKPERIRDV